LPLAFVNTLFSSYVRRLNHRQEERRRNFLLFHLPVTGGLVPARALISKVVNSD